MGVDQTFVWIIQVVLAGAVGVAFKMFSDVRRENKEERQKMWEVINRTVERASVLESQNAATREDIKDLKTEMTSGFDKVNTKVDELPTRIVSMLRAARNEG